MEKKSLSSNCQKFIQYRQNQQSPLTSNHRTRKTITMEI